MIFLQYYSLALVAIDAYELYSLYTAETVSLSEGTVWFDLFADTPVSVLLYTFGIAIFILSRLAVVLQPVNRWAILHNVCAEFVRLVLFSYLFTVNRAASSINTMLLTFMGCNVVLYSRNYYTTKLYLEGNLES